VPVNVIILLAAGECPGPAGEFTICSADSRIAANSVLAVTDTDRRHW